jgi:hypothetical protein
MDVKSKSIDVVTVVLLIAIILAAIILFNELSRGLNPYGPIRLQDYL